MLYAYVQGIDYENEEMWKVVDAVSAQTGEGALKPEQRSAPCADRSYGGSSAPEALQHRAPFRDSTNSKKISQPSLHSLWRVPEPLMAPCQIKCTTDTNQGCENENRHGWTGHAQGAEAGRRTWAGSDSRQMIAAEHLRAESHSRSQAAGNGGRVLASRRKPGASGRFADLKGYNWIYPGARGPPFLSPRTLSLFSDFVANAVQVKSCW